MNQDEYVKEEILEERTDPQDYLKGRRKQVMKIAEKRKEKVQNDVNEKAALVTQLTRLNARIRETKSEIGHQSCDCPMDTLLANGNMEGAFNVLGQEVSQWTSRRLQQTEGSAMRRKIFALAESKEKSTGTRRVYPETEERKREVEKDARMFDRLCLAMSGYGYS